MFLRRPPLRIGLGSYEGVSTAILLHFAEKLGDLRIFHVVLAIYCAKK